MSRWNTITGNQALMGADQVAALVGAWQTITGAGMMPTFAMPFSDHRSSPGGWAPPAYAVPQAPQAFHGPYGGNPYVPQYGNRAPAFGPRNGLIDNPPPNAAGRLILPISSSGLITGAATVTARSQLPAFRPERLIISNASDWTISDVKVGNTSQFVQAGDIPGEVFAATTIDAFVNFQTIQTAMDFVVQVNYIGASSNGLQFTGAALGTGATSW